MSNSKKNYNKWILVGFFTVPVSYLLMIFFLWYLNFFEFTEGEASAKIVGTAITLGSGLVATMVTLIGLILRHSVENRNADLREEAEKRLKLEGERNKDLQEEAEKRLKLETAIRAVDLLGTDSGDDSAETQRTGALFSLAHLGSIDLAVELVSIMRPAGLIGPGATSSLIDLALRCDDIRVQERASGFLLDHSETFLAEEGFEWPEYISHNWPSELSFDAKNDAFKGFMKLILARPKGEWKRSTLNWFTASLTIAFRSEQDARLKSNIAICLTQILRLYSLNDVLYLPDENLEIKTVHKYLLETDTEFTSLQGEELAARLRKWVDESEEKTDINLT